MDREAWRVHGVAKSRTRLSDWTEWCGMFECTEEAMSRVYFSIGWASGYVFINHLFLYWLSTAVQQMTLKLSGFSEQHSSSHGFCRAGIGAQLVWASHKTAIRVSDWSAVTSKPSSPGCWQVTSCDLEATLKSLPHRTLHRVAHNVAANIFRASKSTREREQEWEQKREREGQGMDCDLV